MEFKLVNVTDAYIDKLSEGRRVTEAKDLQLSYSKKTSGLLSGVERQEPVKGGLYDAQIFGSRYSDRCACGSTREMGVVCPRCRTEVLPLNERLKRWAKYDVGFYYTTQSRRLVLWSLLLEIFGEKNITTHLPTFNPQNLSVSKFKDTLLEEVLNFAEFRLQSENGVFNLYITEDITNADWCSFEGIRGVIKRVSPSSMSKLDELMNRLIPITPTIYRDYRFARSEGKRILMIPKATIGYRAIITMVTECNKKCEEDVANPYKQVCYKAGARKYIEYVLSTMTDIHTGSKSNTFREAYSDRVGFGSGRAVISPDPTLKITEVGVPLFMCYEMYAKEFCTYLIKEHNMLEWEAVELWRNGNNETIAEFTEWVENIADKYILLNRNPTLHKYNILCLKVRVRKGNTLKIPMLLCTCYNGDFDGDELNVYAIPDKYREYARERACPSTMRYFDKDHTFLYKFRHEIVNGIYLLSTLVETDNIKQYNSFQELDDAYEDGEVECGTKVLLCGAETSWGREQLSRYAPLSYFSNGVDWDGLYEYIAQLGDEEMVECLYGIQCVSFKAVKYACPTTLSLQQYIEESQNGVADEFRQFEREIDNLEKNVKFLKIEEKMGELNELFESRMNPKTKQRIKESGGRMKMGAMRDMCLPTIVYESDGTYKFFNHSIVEGMEVDEWINHALNNRKLLALKFEAVPTSGYLTRQLATLGRSLYLENGEDVQEMGIKMPMFRAWGRTKMDGSVVEKSKSKELVEVRSFITSSKEYLTPDMLPHINNLTYDTNGRGNIGVQLVMAFTEAMTQQGLSLKHGGSLRLMTKDTKCYACEDMTITFSRDRRFMYCQKKGASVEKYYLSPRAIFDASKKEYKSGDLIYMLDFTHTFSYNLDCVVKLCNALGKVTMEDVKDTVEVDRVFCLKDNSVVHYDTDKGVVQIGTETLKLKDTALYFHPEGAVLKKGERFRSGIEDVRNLDMSYVERYYIFRESIIDLIPSMSEEVIEIVYSLICNKADGEFVGVTNANKDNKSFITCTGFGYQSEVLERAVRGEKEFILDPQTRVVLPENALKRLLLRDIQN